MGSFNVTCAGSNLSINYGKKVKLFILIPANRYNCKTGDMTNVDVTLPKHGTIIDNLFDLFCLPLTGTYDSYGGIENIEEDFTTKALERFFNVKIKEFVDKLVSGRTDGFTSEDEYSKYPEGLTNLDSAKMLHCCFMLEPIYEKLISLSNSMVWHYKAHYKQEQDFLDKLGFTKNKFTAEKIEQYNEIIYGTTKASEATIQYMERVGYFHTHSKVANLELFDGVAINIESKKCKSYYKGLKTLDEILTSDYQTRLEVICDNTSFLYEDMIDVNSARLQEEMKAWLGEELLEDMISKFSSRVIDKSYIYTHKEIYDNIKEFYKLSLVKDSLISCDRQLMPMSHGEQHGNLRKQQRLLTHILEIVEQDLEEEAREAAEDEDD
jgi:hypothetical protein